MVMRMFTDRAWPAVIALPAALATVLLVAACGSTESGSDSAGNSAQPPGTSANPPGSPSVGRPLETTPPPTDPTLPTDLPSLSPTGAPVTVRGTVVAGVEGGCLMLNNYQLVVADAALRQVVRAGAEVEVSGRLQPDLMTFCQQGTPLVVTSARAV